MLNRVYSYVENSCIHCSYIAMRVCAYVFSIETCNNYYMHVYTYIYCSNCIEDVCM